MLTNKKSIVIYHGSCADGFSAAWCFWKKYKDNMEYFKGVYNEPPPDVKDRHVFLVDFSYTRPIVEKMVAEAISVTLIDHHVTAINNLKDLPGLDQTVDLNKSGATLAWDYVFPNSPRPLLLGHVEDRDLWKFKLPNTREIQANLFSQEYTFEIWDELMAADQIGLLKMTVAGAAIERKHQKDIKELLSVVQRTMNISGFEVPAASLPYTMSSDAGALMGVGKPFAACYWDTKDHRIFSLRSEETGGLDVAKIAESYGGGGHKHASGFRVPRSHILATS